MMIINLNVGPDPVQGNAVIMWFNEMLNCVHS